MYLYKMYNKILSIFNTLTRYYEGHLSLRWNCALLMRYAWRRTHVNNGIIQ